MTKELAKTLTTALVQFIDRERPEGTMCCSSYECEKIEKAFEGGTYDVVENLIQRKLTGLATEFEQELAGIIFEWGENDETKISNYVKKCSPKLIALAKKQLLSYPDESNPAIEAMADLERTYFNNPDKLPKWLKDALARENLEGYTKGRNDAFHKMSDFMKSYSNTQSGTSTAKAEG